MRRASPGLAKYAIARVFQSIPLLLAIIVLSFTLIQLSPGDPITALVGDFPAPEAYIEQTRTNYGLDQPAWRQLLLYMKNVITGDFGHSFVNRLPVLSLIANRAVPTVLLMTSGMTIAVVFGLLLGVLSSRRPHSALDSSLQVVGLAGYAMPVFWLGQLMLLLFAVKLGWFPAGGMGSLRNPTEGLARMLEVARYLTLPALALSVRYVAINMRMTRAGMLEALRSDYVTAARARGMPERIVTVKHALRNALLPVVTVIGYNLGFALSGSVLVETVFNWPGLGRLLFDSISARDYPTMIGIFLVVTVTVVIVNLITDILYAYLDPRIQY